jgi:hypothetical protein
MLYHVLSNGVASTPATLQLKIEATPTLIATRQTHPDLFISQIKPEVQLSTNDRIASLEGELFQLRGRKVEPSVLLTRPSVANGPVPQRIDNLWSRSRKNQSDLPKSELCS